MKSLFLFLRLFLRLGSGEFELLLLVSDHNAGMQQGNTNRRRSLVITRTNRLPGSAATLEVPERLGQLKRLNDNPLLLLIVSQLRVSGQREILAQRVAVEAVVGHDATQIRVAGEEDAEHVVNLTLVPKGTLEQARHAGNRVGLIGVGLDADARVVSHAEQVVDHLESLVLGRVVDRRDIGDLRELARRVVLQEAHHRDDPRRRHVDGQLVLPHRELLHVLGHTRHDVLPVLVQAFGLVLVLVRRVDDGSTEGLGGYRTAN